VCVKMVFMRDSDKTELRVRCRGAVIACMVAKVNIWESNVKGKCLDKEVREVVVELVVAVV
ncbi:hypothetical protein U1Q18_030829, partial [Sarracenia purpurea var. burkii]